MTNEIRITAQGADLTESTTKRVDGGITEDATKRVTQDASDSTVIADRLINVPGDTWKSCWGEADSHEAGSGANTFFRTFVGWFSTPRIEPSDQSTKRVGSGVSGSHEKRVPSPNP